jgi:hypothetical protein
MALLFFPMSVNKDVDVGHQHLSAQPVPILLLEGDVKFGGLVLDTPAGAPVSNQRKRGRGTRRAAQALSQRVIHNVAHGLVPLGRTELRLPKELIV